MLGYSRIELPVSGCVHFVRNDDVNGDLREIVAHAKSKGIVCGYLDYMDTRGVPGHITDHIARTLKLDNPPYGGAPSPWIPFLDDLITLSDRVDGMALVVDNAHVFLREDQNNFFDFIESFLMQLHHWFEKQKPCHLCFQVERNDLVRQAFAG